MTSNVGSRWIAELGPGQEERVKERALESLRQQFTPEFLNRVDEFVVFRSLGREQLRSIVEIQLRRAAASLERQRIHLEATPAAMDLLAEKGFDPQYGARPLRRTIQREVMNPLALAILDGRFQPGDTVQVDAGKGNGLVFSRVGAEQESNGKITSGP
jgi:ATP-dependent Clp protease ATP-binding subunit ClpB